MVYTLASLICATSGSVYVLIGGRILQALGAGCIVTISTALIKDCFSGEKLTRILSITQALNVIAPMAAPIIGSLLLLYTSWRGAFVLLAFLGSINIIIALLLTDHGASSSGKTIYRDGGTVYGIACQIHQTCVFHADTYYVFPPGGSIYGLCQCIILRIHEYISPVTAVVWALFLFQFHVCCSRPVPLSAYCRQGFQSPYHQCLFPCYCNQWCSTSYYWLIQCSMFHAELSAVHDYRIHSASLCHGCAS